jgi:uncharacterized protein involved in type VI secretion and phage assembly
MDEETESGWARVVGVGAGPQAGLDCMPAVNDEVLVAFEHGDFNHPFVLGGLWSQKKQPPDPSASASKNERAMVRTWRSRNGHFIAMHETAADKKVEIVTAGGHTIVLDDTKKLLQLKSNSGYTVALNDQSQKVEVTHTSGQKVTLDSMAVTVASNGNIVLDAKGMIDIKANGPVNIKGAMVNIN